MTTAVRGGGLIAASVAASIAAILAASSCTDTNNNAPVVASGPGGETPVFEPGYLWYAGGGLNQFLKADTDASTNRGPALVVVPALSVTSYHDLVFDSAGNLWTIPIFGDQIIRLRAADLSVGPPPTPDLIVTSAALKGPQSLAFDASGNLWVLNYNGAGPSVANVVRFDDPRGLSGNQVLSPTATVGPGTDPDNVTRFSQGNSIAFDAAGDLWLAAVSNVLRIDGAASPQGQLDAAPSASISTGDACASIAFDATGALWITGALSGYFVRRIDHPEALTGAVGAAPAATVQLPSGAALFAGGMAFDAAGALWIAMSDEIVKLENPDALVGDQTPEPAVVLGLPLAPDLASKLVFQPTPTGLPIY